MEKEKKVLSKTQKVSLGSGSDKINVTTTIKNEFHPMGDVAEPSTIDSNEALQESEAG